MKRIFVSVMAVCLLAVSLLLGACSAGTVKLKMSGLTYDPLTACVSWSAVKHATGYQVEIEGEDAFLVPAPSDAEKGSRLQIFMEKEESGTYAVTVTAIGDGERYLDSTAKTLSVNYADPYRLSLSLTYDSKTRTFTWLPSQNCSAYSVTVTDPDGEEVTTLITEPVTEDGTTFYRFLLPGLDKAGNYKVSIYAVGESPWKDSTAYIYYVNSLEGFAAP